MADKGSVSVRAATSSDMAILLEFEQKVLEAERPYNSAIKEEGAFYYDLNELIASDESYLLVAEAENQVVGSGYAKIVKSKQSMTHDLHSYLGFMYVKPEFRGKGVNQLIVKELIRWSSDNGVYDHYLDVYSDNEGAIRAYEKAGFKGLMIEMRLRS